MTRKVKLLLVALAAMGALAAYMVTGAFGHTGQIVAKCGSITFNYSGFPSNTHGGNQVNETWTVNGVTTNKTENFGNKTSAAYTYSIASTGHLTVSASANWTADGGGHTSPYSTTLDCGGGTTTTTVPVTTTNTVTTTQTVTTQSPPPPPVTTTQIITVKVPTKQPPVHHKPHKPVKHHKPHVPPKKHIKHPRKPHISYTK